MINELIIYYWQCIIIIIIYWFKRKWRSLRHSRREILESDQICTCEKIQIWDIVFYLGASELLGGKVISGGSIDIFTLFLLLYHGPVDHRRAFQRIHATDFNKPRAPVSCLRVAQYPLSGHGDFKYLLRTTRVCVATCMHACTHVWVSRTQEKVHRSEGNRTVVYDRSRKSHDPIESNAVLYNAVLVANKDALNKSRNRYNSGKFHEHARMIFA